MLKTLPSHEDFIERFIYFQGLLSLEVAREAYFILEVSCGTYKRSTKRVIINGVYFVKCHNYGIMYHIILELFSIVWKA